jgi:hypothetical protein
MATVDERTTANMDVVFEEVFEGVPHGGDHESRKHVAKKLIQSAKKRKRNLGRVKGRSSRRAATVINSEVSLIFPAVMRHYRRIVSLVVSRPADECEPEKFQGNAEIAQ